MTSSHDPTETFPHKATLDPNYHIFWKTNQSSITFEAHVAAHGYVGFGLTANASGAMYPGDVVMGYVSNGQSYFGDYHTDRHGQPIRDGSQDWTLLLATEDNEGTIMKFSRALHTRDKPDDIDINSGISHVIWSYSREDPIAPTNYTYHRALRGSMDLELVSGGGTPVGRALL
ncbi:hypothetical protein DPMN_033616 [Dreissena polymorpha]|nr:hypothetical protein DPMN_033616 [Dreissena polymorpha]